MRSSSTSCARASDFADGSDWRSAQAGPGRRRPGRSSSRTTGVPPPSREPLTLDEALDAFTKPPLDQVKIDLDIKICGREDEIVEAVRSRGLARAHHDFGHGDPTIRALGEIAPELSRGWTIPRVTPRLDQEPRAAPARPGAAWPPSARACRGVVAPRGTAPGRRVDLDPPRPRDACARRRRPRRGLHPRRLDRRRRRAHARARRDGRRRHLHERPAPFLRSWTAAVRVGSLSPFVLLALSGAQAAYGYPHRSLMAADRPTSSSSRAH